MRALFLALLVACVPSKNPGSQNDATRRLHALFDEEWEYSLRESPLRASSLGDLRNADRWDDVSLAAQARRQAHDREVLTKIGQIPKADLGREDAISYDLFRYDYEDSIAAAPFRQYLLAINQREGIQTADTIADELPFTKEKDYEAYNARLRSFPQYVDQTIELLNEGVRSSITQPRIVMDRVVKQLDKQIVEDPATSPFFLPYQKTTSPLQPAVRERYASQAKDTIRTAIVPAFQKLKTFWTTTYLPACKLEVGAWNQPNGKALYEHLVHSHTTTKLSPDEVHAIGLREVARIRGEMEATKARAGFKGSLKEMFTFLRTDPGFFYTSGPELLVAYRDLSKRIDPLLTKVFSRLPRSPYGVQPIADHIAPDTTTAFYRPGSPDRAGTYFVNLYEPASRPKWEMPALTLHEAVPGHHLQIALAMEQENLPMFRRHAGYTSFVEGWALYAESLGEEMGLYDDPYAKMGQLTYEMWRAVRLVVDTGIHHLKWDRARAIEFFMENAPKAELDIVNEVDRYIAWPGQALAYKIGELKIKELRKRESSKPTFNLKAFHEKLLQSGPLPLSVLEKRFEQ